MTLVKFAVPGVPAPQGSKTRTRWGVREDNPATRPWRAAVAWEAAAAMQGRALLQGPLALEAVFYFPRPQSHFRSGKHAGELKPGAAKFHISTPDGDKLMRAIGDSLKGIVCRDDSLIAEGHYKKRYGSPRAEVLVYEMEPKDLTVVLASELSGNRAPALTDRADPARNI